MIFAIAGFAAHSPMHCTAVQAFRWRNRGSDGESCNDNLVVVVLLPLDGDFHLVEMLPLVAPFLKIRAGAIARIGTVRNN